MRTRKMLALSLVASLALVAGACGGDDSESDDTSAGGDTTAAETTEPEGGDTTAPAGGDTTAPSGEAASIGLLFDITGRGDKSFNDAAAAGLDQATSELGVTGTESTPTSDSDRAERLNLLVSEGNDLIIGVGFLWGDAVKAGATANPDQQFGIVDFVVTDDAGEPLPNVASMVFAEEQGSFLVGAAAALKSQSGTIGFVGGVEQDLIKKFEAGYIAGAKAVNPDIEVLTNYISQPPDFSGFNDAAKGKLAAASMYEAGADVVYHAAGATGLGVFQAAKEAGAPGEVWAIGVDSDQYNQVEADLQPYILTSMLKRVDVAVYETIKSVVDGTFAGGPQVFDLARDGVGYSTSGGFIDDITDQLDAFAEQIKSGEIEVPTTPEG